jgi:hypothetical protein
LRDQNWISAYYGHRGFEIALTHKKSLAGTVRNYNWKIFACLVGFGNVFAEDRVSRGALDVSRSMGLQMLAETPPEI